MLKRKYFFVITLLVAGSLVLLTVYVSDDLIYSSRRLAQSDNIFQMQFINERLKNFQRLSKISFILVGRFYQAAFTEKLDAFLQARVLISSYEIRMLEFRLKIVFLEPREPAICSSVDSDSDCG
jgi:hypothetical protein